MFAFEIQASRFSSTDKASQALLPPSSIECRVVSSSQTNKKEKVKNCNNEFVFGIRLFRWSRLIDLMVLVVHALMPGSMTGKGKAFFKDCGRSIWLLSPKHPATQTFFKHSIVDIRQHVLQAFFVIGTEFQKFRTYLLKRFGCRSSYGSIMVSCLTERHARVAGSPSRPPSLDYDFYLQY